MPALSPVRVLALIVSSADHQSLNTENEWRNLSDALAPLSSRDRSLVLERLNRPTEMALRRRLAEKPYDILHIIGNCRSQSARYATLTLESQDGYVRTVTAQHLGMLLQTIGSTRLVVVEAAADQDEACEKVAERLIEQGVPAVVVARRGGNSRTFYEAILDGECLRKAAAPPWALKCVLSSRELGSPFLGTLVEDALPAPPRKAALVAPEPSICEGTPIQQELGRKRAAGAFDVFLCHNTADKSAVRKIAEALMDRGILPWLDERELRPGMPWQRLLEDQIASINAAAVFVGSDGIGPWQRHELDAFLRAFVARECPVIPVLLITAPDRPQLPIFLGGMTWVDFRSTDPDPLGRLIWGITGRQTGSR